MKESTREFLREIVAPTAARIALPAVAAQYKREGTSRDEFLARCGEAYDEATHDDATQPDASLPTDPPPASEEPAL